MDTNQLPNKTFFRIGEVSRVVGVDPHVLRYWEGEFPQIEPQKGKGRQRLFRRDDVLLLIKIRHLLYEKGYTIEGARKSLAASDSSDPIRSQITAELGKLASKLQKYRSVGA